MENKKITLEQDLKKFQNSLLRIKKLLDIEKLRTFRQNNHNQHSVIPVHLYFQSKQQSGILKGYLSDDSILEIKNILRKLPRLQKVIMKKLSYDHFIKNTSLSDLLTFELQIYSKYMSEYVDILRLLKKI